MIQHTKDIVYSLIRTGNNYTEGRQQCLDLAMDMAIITDEKEEEFIRDVIK